MYFPLLDLKSSFTLPVIFSLPASSKTPRSRWYCSYALSYRNIEEMIAERGLKIDREFTRE